MSRKESSQSRQVILDLGDIDQDVLVRHRHVSPYQRVEDLPLRADHPSKMEQLFA